jgi:hypothetical protein
MSLVYAANMEGRPDLHARILALAAKPHFGFPQRSL